MIGDPYLSKSKTQCNDTLDMSFNTLIEHACQTLILLLLDLSKPFEIETNASDYAIVAFEIIPLVPLKLCFEGKKLNLAQTMARQNLSS